MNKKPAQEPPAAPRRRPRAPSKPTAAAEPATPVEPAASAEPAVSSTPPVPSALVEPPEEEATNRVGREPGDLALAMSPRQIIGGFALLAGLILMLRRRRRKG